MTAPTQDLPRVARPPIDPRIRDRRIEVIRAAGRKRLRITLVVASVIVVFGLAYLTVRSPLLDVDHVRIEGAQQERASAIRDAAQIRNGSALLFVNTGAIAERIEKLPWVEHAVVERDFPGTIKIAVTEYGSGAFVRMSATQVALIAPTGRVVAYAETATPGAVQVFGAKAPNVGELLSPPEAANVLHFLPTRLAQQIQAVDLGGANPALALPGRVGTSHLCKMQDGGVPSNPQIRLGDFTELRDKGNAALRVLDDLSGKPFTYIDVSVPQSPVSC